MRISDWSSDVCSSDLAEATPNAVPAAAPSPTSTPAPAATTPAAGAADDTNSRSLIPLVLALLAIAVTAGLVWLWLARRRGAPDADEARSEEHTSGLQSLMRISYAVF